MSCVEGAVVAQVPGPNQYWEHIKSKDRAYFIGRDPDGRLVWQCEGDCIEVGNLDWSGWRHIPGCTGWDWEPDQVEEYPQYWTSPAVGSTAAFVKRVSKTECVTVMPSGTYGPMLNWEHSFPEQRTRLTEQEALALLDKPAVGCADIQNGPIEISNDQAEKMQAILDRPAKTWPKYYINRDPGCKWYVRAENHRKIPNVYLPDGSACTSQANWDDIDDSLRRGVWTEVTEAEARARIAVDKAPAEVWPKYYVGYQWNDKDAYIRYDGPESSGVWVNWHGTETVFAGDHYSEVAETVENGSWRQVTEAEAKARVTKAAEPTIEVQFLPVAPEMDWVVQDRVPARHNVDEWCWCKRGSSPGHFYSGFGGWSDDIRHGHIMGDEVLHLRCRRKDLPPVPAPVAAETFPQWYILKDDEKRSWVPDWTIKRTGEETAIRYARDEAGELYATDEPWTGAAECWQRCSDAEAIERLGTDAFPEVPAEPRRVPVKLWVTYRLNDEGGDWPVRATQADQTCQNWKEIKFDGNGAFIEVEQ